MNLDIYDEPSECNNINFSGIQLLMENSYMKIQNMVLCQLNNESDQIARKYASFDGENFISHRSSCMYISKIQLFLKLLKLDTLLRHCDVIIFMITHIHILMLLSNDDKLYYECCNGIMSDILNIYISLFHQ